MNQSLPNNQITESTKRPARFWITILIVLLAIIVVVVTVVSIGKKNQPGKTSISAYNYSALVDSKLQGSRTSMEFLRPKEFNLSAGKSSILESLYIHNGKDSQVNPTVIGSIAGFAPHYIIADNPAVDLSAVRNSFNTTSDYQNYAKQVYITSFLSDQIKASYFNQENSSNTSISLSQPKSITTANLATDTWQFPFTAVNSDKPNLKVQGEIIFHLGKDTSVYNGYDYLMLSTVDSSWQANQSIWQQIVSSLKITEK